MGHASDPKLYDGRQYVMPVIVPSDFSATVRALLDLAEDPRHDVATTTEYARLGVVVPDYLYERWQRYVSLEATPHKDRSE